MSTLRILPGLGERDVTAILEAAKNADLQEVFVIGWTKDNDLFTSGSVKYREEASWMMRVAEHVLVADLVRPDE